MKKIFYAIIATALVCASCTNLDETIYSQVPKKDFVASPENLALYTSRPYTMLQNWGSEQSMWTMVMQLSDEMCVPGSWDGSWKEPRYSELQSHDIPSSNKLVRCGWDFCFNGISACNDAIYEIEQAGATSDLAKKNIAEIKILRAYYYLLAVDCFGNVPFSVDKTQTGYPEQKKRKEMCKWIEEEIEANIGYLDETVSDATYGRVTRDVALFILAKLYLNSEVWTGEERWSETESVCREIMDSWHYSLTAKYKDNFCINNNETSTEAIFAIPYSSIYTKSCFYIFALTLNSDIQKIWQVGETWNGTHMGQPDFMATYEPGDTRKGDTWLFGQVYDTKGNKWQIKLKDEAGNDVLTDYILEDVNIPEERFGKLDRFDGARIIKWNYQSDGTLTSYKISMENDFILMRYADVVLMYAEALIRQNRAGEAAADPEFQFIRYRAGLEPFDAADLDLDTFFLEREHELAMEGWERQDLIRFGKYTRKWWAKAAGKDYMNLLPIPEQARGANPNLVQNPGYGAK